VSQKKETFFQVINSILHINHIVTGLFKAFLGNGSVNTVNVQNERFISVDECYWALLGNSAPMKALGRNHVTCSLCSLPYATIELGSL
jgi:hypothetical protein